MTRARPKRSTWLSVQPIMVALMAPPRDFPRRPLSCSMPNTQKLSGPERPSIGMDRLPGECEQGKMDKTGVLSEGLHALESWLSGKKKREVLILPQASGVGV